MPATWRITVGLHAHRHAREHDQQEPLAPADQVHAVDRAGDREHDHQQPELEHEQPGAQSSAVAGGCRTSSPTKIPSPNATIDVPDCHPVDVRAAADRRAEEHRVAALVREEHAEEAVERDASTKPVSPASSTATTNAGQTNSLDRSGVVMA